MTHDPHLAYETRLRLWAEQLELPIELRGRDPIAVIDQLFGPISNDQLARQNADQPLTQRLARLLSLSKRSGRAQGPLEGLFVDG